MISTLSKRNLGNTACFQWNPKENKLPIKLFKTTFPHFGFTRSIAQTTFPHFGFTKSIAQPSFMVATPKFCLPCSEFIHEHFKEVFIDT